MFVLINSLVKPVLPVSLMLVVNVMLIHVLLENSCLKMFVLLVLVTVITVRILPLV